MDEAVDFRISVWPGGTVPVPPLVAYEAWLVDGEFVHFEIYSGFQEEAEASGLTHFAGDLYVDRGGPLRSTRVELPPEFYLRELRDLRLDDPDDILRFTNNWGVLGRPRLEEIGEPWLDTELLSFSKGESYQGRQNLWRDMMKLVSPHLRHGEDWDFRKFVHYREIAAHAALIRDLSRIWDVVSGGRELASLAEDWDSWWLPPPQHPLLAQGLLVDFLSHALRPFHINLSLMVGERVVRGRWAPTLFAATCLQLANDIALQQPYRRCQKCGRLFVLQRGRAKYGQHRREGELKYCSSNCAKAHAQRDLYRRQVRARELHAQGMDEETIAQALDAKIDSVRRWTGHAGGRK